VQKSSFKLRYFKSILLIVLYSHACFSINSWFFAKLNENEEEKEFALVNSQVELELWRFCYKTRRLSVYIRGFVFNASWI
jgi:hypothetical protein